MNDWIQIGGVLVHGSQVQMVAIDYVQKPSSILVYIEGQDKGLVADTFTSVGLTCELLDAAAKKLPPGFIRIGMVLCRRDDIVAVHVDMSAPQKLKVLLQLTLTGVRQQYSQAAMLYSLYREAVEALELIQLRLCDNAGAPTKDQELELK